MALAGLCTEGWSVQPYIIPLYMPTHHIIYLIKQLDCLRPRSHQINRTRNSQANSMARVNQAPIDGQERVLTHEKGNPGRTFDQKSKLPLNRMGTVTIKWSKGSHSSTVNSQAKT